MLSSSLKTLCSLGLISLISAACDEPEAARRAPALRRCVLPIRVQLVGQPREVSALGSFNDYDPLRAPLSLLDEGKGEWGADLALPPGEHLYALSVDGRVFNDPSAKLSDLATQGPWRGEERSLVRVPSCEQGRWYRVAPEEGAAGEASISLAYERATLTRHDEGWRELPSGAALQQSTVQLRVRRSGEGEPRPLPFEWRADAPEALRFSTRSLPAGKHWLSLSGQDSRGEPFETLSAPFWVEPSPFKWESGPMYQVVLDRLNPPARGSGEPSPSIAERWGGGLESSLELLRSGYFERLGVRSLWLSPVYQNPQGLWSGVEGGSPRYEGYHGYWPTLPRAVGEEWGGAAALDELVNEAHERGLRVILDVVLNHVHREHPYLSEHPEWFSPSGCLCGRGSCDWGRYIQTCQFTDYLPDVRWSPEALRAQVEDALWWLERFDLDGLRVDAVPMMPRRVTRYLSALVHERLEPLGVRHLLLGETFTGPREWSRLAWYLGPWGLDGQFDFSLMWAIRDAVAWVSAPLSSVAEAWDQAQLSWGASASVMGLFVGNHDVTRFTSEAAGQLPADPWLSPPPQPLDARGYTRLALGYALTLTLPGLPVLYYGDEVGLAGANDPDNRRPFWPLSEHAWAELSEPRRALNLKLTRLAQLRACLPGLQSSALSWVSRGAERLIFTRGSGDDSVVVIIQREPREALRLTELEALIAEGSGWRVAHGATWGEGEELSAWPTEALDLQGLAEAPWSLTLITRSSKLDGCLSSAR